MAVYVSLDAKGDGNYPVVVSENMYDTGDRVVDENVLVPALKAIVFIGCAILKPQSTNN